MIFFGYTDGATISNLTLEGTTIKGVNQVGALVGAGATAAMGQFGVTAAYRFAEPRSIAAWDYTNILFAALFGLLLFEQVPDALSVIGFVAIVVSALMLRKA